MFEYKSFKHSMINEEYSSKVTKLNSIMNKWGAEGWRLHTFEPIKDSFGGISIFVVMDRLIVNEEESSSEDQGEPAMKMRG